MEVINTFSKHLVNQDRSINTRNSYCSDIKQFLTITKKDLYGIHDLHVDHEDILFFKEKLLEDEKSIKTINRKIAAINCFIAFLNEKYDKAIDIKIKQERLQEQHFVTDMLSNSDVKKLISAALDFKDIRAAAICYTLFYTGCRVSEMLQLKLKDIKGDSITVKGKGSKYRELLIPQKLRGAWETYSSLRLNSSERLFTGERGAINRQTVHNTIKYYSKIASVAKEKCHAHAFRHLYARNLDDRGVNIVIISQLLGHKLNVTGTYIQKSKKELLDIINKIELE